MPKTTQEIIEENTEFSSPMTFRCIVNHNDLWFSQSEIREAITSLRDYCQKEYDKLLDDRFEDNIYRSGQIRILNKLLVEMKL